MFRGRRNLDMSERRFARQAQLGDVRVLLCVAGATSGDVGASLVVAGAAFGDVGAPLFVAGAAFGEILVDSRRANYFFIQSVFQEPKGERAGGR